jgi:hypothetical protein
MKNLILVIAAVCFAAIVSAQSATTPAATNGVQPASAATPATAKATAAVWYGCPKCDYTSQKEGKCPHDQSSLVKDHAYYCADGATSDKAGKCKDGKDMAMMDCKAKIANAKKAAKPAPASTTPATAAPTK